MRIHPFVGCLIISIYFYGCNVTDSHTTKNDYQFLGSILFSISSGCIQYPTKSFVKEYIWNKYTNSTSQFEYERICSFHPQEISYHCYVNGFSEILYSYFSLTDFDSKFKQLTVLDGLRKKMNSQFEENYQRDELGRLYNYVRKDDSYGETYFEWDALKRVKSGKIAKGECAGTVTNWEYNDRSFHIENLTDSGDPNCQKKAIYQYDNHFQIQGRILEGIQFQTRSEYYLQETGSFCLQVD